MGCKDLKIRMSCLLADNGNKYKPNAVTQFTAIHRSLSIDIKSHFKVIDDCRANITQVGSEIT